MKLSMKTLSAACLLALAPAISSAGIVPAIALGSPSAISGGFLWSYDAHSSSDGDVLQPANLVGNATNLVPRNDANRGGFFTIYDFNGYIAGSCAGPTGWVCTVQNLGFTPDDVSPAVDDPNIVNLTWANVSAGNYLGNPLATPPVGNDLGIFTAASIYGDQQLEFYTSRVVKSTGALAEGTIADNVGQTIGPKGPNNVPEPGSLALMALGLGSLSMIRRRNKKTA